MSKTFFKKARSKDTLVKELLDAIPIPDIDKDVSSSEDKSKFPSHKLKIDAHVKGTTWDFCVGGDSDKQADAHSSDDRVAAPAVVKNEDGVLESDSTAFIEAMMQKTGVLGESEHALGEDGKKQ